MGKHQTAASFLFLRYETKPNNFQHLPKEEIKNNEKHPKQANGMLCFGMRMSDNP